MTERYDAGWKDYDSWADIYDVWVDTAPAAGLSRPFYLQEYLNEPGSVVELGVGNGRILIEAARQGKAMIGVDSSASMLALCRERAEIAGVAPLVHLIQADFRGFELSAPAALIAIPFHTIGHLVTLEDKRAGLRHIHSQLLSGGRLIFDHFIFDPEIAAAWSGVPRLRTEGRDSAGRRFLLWVCNDYDIRAQVIRCVVWTDLLDEPGVVIERRYRSVSFSWIQPEQIRSLLDEVGFETEAVYGDFDRGPLDQSSREQIWVTRRR